uniref:Uncharacterized protein n=1 Tax=Arundo donax TaxID=35708 RepID=A0A0A9GXQ2_ARUDO
MIMIATIGFTILDIICNSCSVLSELTAISLCFCLSCAPMTAYFRCQNDTSLDDLCELCWVL